METKVKKEYLVLALLIVALSGYLFWQRQERTAYKLPALPAVERDAITRIEIDRPGHPQVHLKSVNGSWHVGAEEYAADGDKIKGMLDIISSLQLTALVSETRSYDRYELDEAHRIRVRAWAGDNLKRDMAIGKSAPTYRHTFVRVGEDPSVYHAREDFRGRFDRDLDQMRDKSVMAFKRDTIRSLTLQAGSGEPVRFTRQGPAESASDKDAKEAKAPAPPWLDAKGQPADSATIDQVLGSLATLECAAYLYDKTKTDLEGKDPQYILTLEGEKSLRLVLFAPEGSGEAEKQRAAISSENDYPFLLSAFLSKELAEQIDKLTGTTPSGGAGQGKPAEGEDQNRESPKS